MASIEDDVREIFGKEIDTSKDDKLDIENVCPTCNKVCQSKRGLAIHQATHNRGSKSKGSTPIDILENRAAEAYLTIFDTIGSTLYLGGLALKQTRSTEIVGSYFVGGGPTFQRSNEQLQNNAKMVGSAIAAKGEESVARIEAIADQMRWLVMFTSHIQLFMTFHQNGQNAVAETRKRRELIEARKIENERIAMESGESPADS